MSYFNYYGKNIFYTETGNGEPCIFLHGNTASSKRGRKIFCVYGEKSSLIRTRYV